MTEDDLLKLDEAMQLVTARRSKYPERLSAYLKKTLEHKTETAEKMTVCESIGTDDITDKVKGASTPMPESLINLRDIIGKDSQSLMVLAKEKAGQLERALETATMLQKSKEESEET